MIKFSPLWITDTTLEDETEGNSVTTTLSAINHATVMVAPGQSSIDIGIDASAVTSVEINGVDASFSTGGNVIFFAAVPARSAVEIRTSTAIVYSAIGGSLPKGLGLSPNGVISGSPFGIRDLNGEHFTFTVRATNGRMVRDRTFNFIVFPVPQIAAWNLGGLPLSIVDRSANSTAYHPLGDVRRGDSFAFTIDVSHPDGDAVQVGLDRNANVVPAANHFNGTLPEGLSIAGNSIEGVVLPSTPPGKYFFDLTVVAPSGPAPVPCMIEVLSSRVSTFKRPVKMRWITPDGNLGSVRETAICTMRVEANDPNGGNVIYTLLPGTGDLPPGLVLNAQTGDIEGQVSYVDATTLYEFRVRATSGSIFADRTFSIVVTDFYSVENLSAVSLKFQGRARVELIRGYKTLIPADWIYRPDDRFFGIVEEPVIHVARGIFPDTTLSKLDYRDNIATRMGEHRIAVVRDPSGKPIYEVLYREVVDPMDEDPFGTDYRPFGLTIDYRQSKEVLQLHPTSIWNMRYDLFADYGMGYEDFLPEWMTSAQETGPLGFITAVAVAYLKPGSGAGMLDLIKDATTLPTNGYAVTFDRVLVSQIGSRRLRFDADLPNFIPFYVPAGSSVVTTARWTNLINEAFYVETDIQGGGLVAADEAVHAIDMGSVDSNLEHLTVTIPVSDKGRVVFFSVVGQPEAEPRANNGPVGTDLIMGACLNGVTRLMINDVSVSNARLTRMTDIGALRLDAFFPAGGEVRVEMSETTFDDVVTDEITVTKFDNQTIEIGKYIKLSDDFKKTI